MVDTENIKSNFVKGLEENNNRILTYVTIFFTFAFLGCLLAFWIYEHRGSRCVFGPACCHTDLVNTGLGNKVAEGILLQQGTSLNWHVGKNPTDPEIITFDSVIAGSGDTYTFTADLYGTSIQTLGAGAGVSFPHPDNSTSGYYINTKGVSLYFHEYLGGSEDFWSQSHKLISTGVCAFFDSANFKASGAKASINSINSPSGIRYETTSSTINEGSNLITTSLTNPKTSFFSNFLKTSSSGTGIGGFVAVEESAKDGTGYNPFMDFLHTKRVVQASDNCSGDGATDCSCVEPSSRNLPSCRAPYNKQLGGYAIIGSDGTITGHSKNCSHSYFSGNTKPAQEGSDVVQPLNDSNTSLGNKLAQAKTNGVIKGVTLNLGGKDFNIANGTGNFGNAFVSEAIFCGAGTKASPTKMYPLNDKNEHVNSEDIGGAMKASIIPNADPKTFRLGFG